MKNEELKNANKEMLSRTSATGPSLLRVEVLLHQLLREKRKYIKIV